MRRFLVKLQFNGRDYSGWQIQKNSRSVQGEVEKALKKLFGADITACGCSRTDAGVSAEEYFFHFDADTKLPESRVAFKLNRFLPRDVQAQESREVPRSFDARRDVKSKTYVYSVCVSEHVMPLYSSTHYRIERPLNIEKMRAEALKLSGTHDFSAFRKIGYEEGAADRSAVRTINFIDIKTKENRVYIYVNGSGFLYNMVRIIAGTLIAAGLDGDTDVNEILISKDRKNAGATLPPKGLKLYKVNY